MKRLSLEHRQEADSKQLQYRQAMSKRNKAVKGLGRIAERSLKDLK